MSSNNDNNNDNGNDNININVNDNDNGNDNNDNNNNNNSNETKLSNEDAEAILRRLCNQRYNANRKAEIKKGNKKDGQSRC